MKYFYDTEFLEDGRTIELISIGIVADDGREYYAVNSEMPLDRIKDNDWLVRNVLAHLPVTHQHTLGRYIAHAPNIHPRPSIEFVDLDRRDSVMKPKWVIANEVRDFLIKDVYGGDPELWAWYAAYDHVVLAQLFGRMVSLPPNIPMWTNDLKQEHVRLGSPVLPKEGADEHHALADARRAQTIHRALQDPSGAP